MRFSEIARYPLQGGTKKRFLGLRPKSVTTSHSPTIRTPKVPPPQIQDLVLKKVFSPSLNKKNISITLHSEPSQGINSTVMEIAWPPNLEMYKFAARNTYSLLREIHIHRCGNCPKLDKEGVTKGPGLDLIRWSSIRVNSNRIVYVVFYFSSNYDFKTSN